MSDWNADDRPFDPLDAASDASWQGDASPPVARVLLASPVTVRMERLHGPEIADGLAGFAVYHGATTAGDDDIRPISRYAMDPEVVDRLFAADVFREPIRLMLGARTAKDGGLDAILYAGLDATTVARLNEGQTTEPWRASAAAGANATRDPSDEGDEGDVEISWLAIGVIRRLPANRRHPDNLFDETADLLATLVIAGGMPVDAKAVENLLDSL